MIQSLYDQLEKVRDNVIPKVQKELQKVDFTRETFQDAANETIDIHTRDHLVQIGAL